MRRARAREALPGGGRRVPARALAVRRELGVAGRQRRDRGRGLAVAHAVEKHGLAGAGGPAEEHGVAAAAAAPAATGAAAAAAARERRRDGAGHREQRAEDQHGAQADHAERRVEGRVARERAAGELDEAGLY